MSKNKQSLFLKNEVVLKKLGRVNSIFTKDSKDESASLVVSGEIFKIYFDKTVDLNTIKDNLRGGTPLIKWFDNTYLCIVHDVDFIPKNHNGFKDSEYYHLFVTFLCF